MFPSIGESFLNILNNFSYKIENNMEKMNEKLERIANALENMNYTKENDEEEKILKKKKMEYNILQFRKYLSTEPIVKDEYELETAEWLGETNYHLPEFTEEDEERMKQLKREIEELERQIQE